MTDDGYVDNLMAIFLRKDWDCFDESVAFGVNYSGVILGALAADPTTPSRVLSFIAQTENEELLLLVAKNPNTDDMVLERLAQHDNPIIKELVLRNVTGKCSPMDIYIAALASMTGTS